MLPPQHIVDNPKQLPTVGAHVLAQAKCSTNEAPWYIVPANHKWYRNLLVARTLVHTLSQDNDEWQAQLVNRGEQELAILEQLGHTRTGNQGHKRSKKAPKAPAAT